MTPFGEVLPDKDPDDAELCRVLFGLYGVATVPGRPTIDRPILENATERLMP